MPIVQASRFQNLLRQSFSLLESIRITLLDDIFPTFPVQDPAEAFLQLQKEVFTVFGGVTVTPAAADFATTDLAPAQASSRAILDVMGVVLSNPGAAATFITLEHIGFAAGAPSTVTQMTPLDGRRIGNENQPQRSQFGFSGQLAGFNVTVANTFQFNLQSGVSLFFPFRATLYRSALRFKANVVNQSMRVGAFGQERLLEPSEERSRVSSAP